MEQEAQLPVGESSGGLIYPRLVRLGAGFYWLSHETGNLPEDIGWLKVASSCLVEGIGRSIWENSSHEEEGSPDKGVADSNEVEEGDKLVGLAEVTE